jgi:hypothetical protein
VTAGRGARGCRRAGATGRAFIRVATTVALGLASTPATTWGGGALAGTRALRAPGARHDVHVSHTRAVVEGNTVALRVRLFADDLEATLRRTSGDPALRLGTPAADTAFARYFARQVGVTADGARLVPRLTGAGTESDAAGIAMRWFLVQLTAPTPVRTLTLRNALMFDTFRDQQNIVAVMRLPGERRTTLFFAAGDEKEQVVP